MYRIYKYEIPITDVQTIEVGWPARLQHLGEQDGKLYGWFVVNPEAEATVGYEIEIVGTGHPTPEDTFHAFGGCTTVQMSNGLVWHVFWSRHG